MRSLGNSPAQLGILGGLFAGFNGCCLCLRDALRVANLQAPEPLGIVSLILDQRWGAQQILEGFPVDHQDRHGAWCLVVQQKGKAGKKEEEEKAPRLDQRECTKKSSGFDLFHQHINITVPYSVVRAALKQNK